MPQKSHKLKVIPKADPKTRTIFQMAPGVQKPFMQGDGDHDLICGGCGAKVAESLPHMGTLTNIVLVCPWCGVSNETEGIDFN